MKNLRNIARCLKFLSDARKGKHKAHGSDEFYVPDERPYTDEVLYVNSGTIPAKAYKGNLNIKKVIIWYISFRMSLKIIRKRCTIIS